ncbi:unnamed protein product, partial [Musa textilis]
QTLGPKTIVSEGYGIDFVARRKTKCNTKTSQGVTHPSATLARERLTSEGRGAGFVARRK